MTNKSGFVLCELNELFIKLVMLIMSRIAFFNTIIVVLLYFSFEVKQFGIIIGSNNNRRRSSNSGSINFILSVTACYQDLFHHNQQHG
jgi:hypothetical protein